MTDLVESYLEKVPKRCRKCPVLARFVLLAGISQYNAGREIKVITNELNNSRPYSDFIREHHVKSLAFNTDFELESIKKLGTLAQLVGDACPGPRRGDVGETGFWRALTFLTGERSCLNPEFVAVKDDPGIDIQLLEGNWYPNEQTLPL